jgi:hypothetical protein
VCHFNFCGGHGTAPGPCRGCRLCGFSGLVSHLEAKVLLTLPGIERHEVFYVSQCGTLEKTKIDILRCLNG